MLEMGNAPMPARRAREIVRTLIAGVHPLTGSPLPQDSPLQCAEVLRALLVADEALRAAAARANRRAALPPKVGHRWDDEELLRLAQGVREKLSLEELARRHGRTRRAIQSRLQLMDPELRGGTMPGTRGEGALAAASQLDPEPLTS